MGGGGVPSGGVYITNNRSLSKYGKPNSIVHRYKNGTKVQTRWYDSKGNAKNNRDFTNHGNAKEHPMVPHDHPWEWSNGEGVRSYIGITPNYIDFK